MCAQAKVYCVLDAPVAVAGLDNISEDDLMTAINVCRQWPHLEKDFKNVVDFLHISTVEPQAYRQLFNKLECINKIIADHFLQPGKGKDNIVTFAVAVGYVEKAVEFCRQIMREMEKKYLTELLPLSVIKRSQDFDLGCLCCIRFTFLNCTALSKEFCVRLARTGYFQDFVEDLIHLKHLAVEALEEGDMYLHSLGVIHNCCAHPEVVQVVKQMDIIHHITPFLDKVNESNMVKTVALLTLAYLVEDDQVDLIRLDHNILAFFLGNLRDAIAAGTLFQNDCTTEELLVGLSLLARNDFNKRLMFAQGAGRILISVLDPNNGRQEAEKILAVATITKLVRDCANLHVFKNDRKAIRILRTLETSDDQSLAESAKDLLTQLHGSSSEQLGAISTTLPCLADILVDKMNLPAILEIGDVEYVMDQLVQFTTEGGRSNGFTDITCIKVLQALGRLAREDERCRRDMMARGALNELTKVLQTGDKEEKAQAARILMNLACCEENKEIMKSQTTLMKCLNEAVVITEHDDLAQTAGIIVQELNH